jgi:PAS domain S-box-containing protein
MDKKILLVEDEAIIALTEIRQLKQAGYTVEHSLSGERAIELLNKPDHGINLILMDIDLGPGIDGTVAARRIIQDHNIPVLFLSSHTEKEIVEKTENITSYGYVVKNSGIVVLDASIKMAMRLFNAHTKLEEQRMELEASREDLEATLEELQSSNEEFEAVNEELIASQDELVKNENELKKQTAMLNKVFEILPVGLWIADKNGTLLTANAAGKKIWGAEPHVPQEEYGVFKARRLPSYEEIAPDDWALSHSINKGITVVDEMLEIDAFDGNKKIILNYTAPIFDDGGGIQGAIIVNQDITAHKSAEDTLKRNEALQKSILLNISDVITILDSSGIIKLKSPNIEKFFGWKPDELLGRSTWDIIHNDDVDKIKLIFNSLLKEEGKTLDGECRYLCADGSFRWIGFTAANLLHDSNISGILINYRDINDKKTAENTLSRIETENHSIIYSIPDLVFNVDSNGIIHKYRAPENSILYVQPEKFLRRNLKEVLPQEVSEPSLKYIKKALETEKMQSMEYILPLEDKLYYFENRIIPLSKNEVLCFIRDITDRKEAENSLRKSEAKFRSYIENSPYPVFVADEKGHYTEVNRAACELTGYSENELLNMKISDLLYKDDINAGGEHFEAVSEKGSSTGELRYVNKNREIRTWSVKAVKLSPDRFLGFVNDITEIKDYENRLTELIHHREILLKELQHRVKNNLNIISGFLSLEINRIADISSKSIFKDTINRIYALSSIYDRLRISDDFSSIDLGDYIEDLVKSIYSTYKTNQSCISIKTELEKVCIDTSRAVPVGIIVNELMTNIFKYAFTEDEKGEVKIFLSRAGSKIELCIADNGKGLPPEVDIKTSDSMGLTLIRVLADQIRGTISVKTGAGRGTEICISLTL